MCACLALLLTLSAPRPPEYTFTFPATQGRLATGLFVDRGERVGVTATGSWTMWAGHFGRSSAVGHRFRVGNFGWGRLMGRIGASAEISIGTGAEWTASDPGLLVLYPNVGDYGVRGGEGELQITVTGGRPLEVHLNRISRGGVRVTVPADRGVVTDVLVSERDLVQIDAFGEWTMYDGGPPLTAEGDLQRLLPDRTPWGKLVARIGGPTFAVGETYPVGASATLRPKRAGLLHFEPAVGQFAGHRRSGSLEVVVRGARLASPEQRQQALQEAAAYERSLAFLRIHQYRHNLNLAPAYCEPALMRAAQAHAEALAAGGEAGSPADRARAAGFAGRLYGDGIHGYTDGVKAIDGFWQTVYQRAVLCDPQARAFGVGVAAGQQPVCVVFVGQTDEAPPYEVRVPDYAQFPAPDQINVPTTATTTGAPSPFASPPGGPTGYPLSLTVTNGELRQVGEAALADARGRRVPCLTVGPGRDPHGRLQHTLFVVPLEPLRPLESYEVAVSFVTDKGEERVAWHFTCGLDREAVLPAPRLGLPANPPIDLG